MTSRRTVCVKSVKWPFNLILICHDLFIVVVAHYLFLLRLLEVFRLSLFTPAPLAAGVATPLTSPSPTPPPYGCHE